MDKEKIIELFPDELKYHGSEILDNIEFVAGHIRKLRTMELIEIHPTNPAKQRITPAGKQLHDYLQTLQNLINTLMRLLNINDDGGETVSTLNLIDELREKYGL